MFENYQNNGCISTYTIQLFQRTISFSTINLNCSLSLNYQKILTYKYFHQTSIIIRYYNPEDNDIQTKMAAIKLLSEQKLISQIKQISDKFDFIVFTNAIVYFRKGGYFMKIKKKCNNQRLKMIYKKICSLGIIFKFNEQRAPRFINQSYDVFMFEEQCEEFEVSDYYYNEERDGKMFKEQKVEIIMDQNIEVIQNMEDNGGIVSLIHVAKLVCLVSNTGIQDLLKLIQNSELGQQYKQMCLKSIQGYYQAKSQHSNQMKMIEQIIKIDQYCLRYKLKLGKLYLKTNRLEQIHKLMGQLSPKSLGYLQLKLLIMLQQKKYQEVERQCTKIINKILNRPNVIPKSDCYPFHEILYKLCFIKSPSEAKQQTKIMEQIIKQQIKQSKKYNRKLKLKRKLVQIMIMNINIQFKLGNYNQFNQKYQEIKDLDFQLTTQQKKKINEIENFAMEKRSKAKVLECSSSSRSSIKKLYQEVIHNYNNTSVLLKLKDLADKQESTIINSSDLRNYQLKIVKFFIDIEMGLNHNEIQAKAQQTLQQIQSMGHIAPNFFRRFQSTLLLILALVSRKNKSKINILKKLSNKIPELATICLEIIQALEKQEKQLAGADLVVQNINEAADNQYKKGNYIRALSLSYQLFSHKLVEDMHQTNQQRIQRLLLYYSRETVQDLNQQFESSNKNADEIIHEKQNISSSQSDTQLIDKLKRQLHTLDSQFGCYHPSTLSKAKQLGQYYYNNNQMFLSLVYLVYFNSRCSDEKVKEMITNCFENNQIKNEIDESEYFDFQLIWEKQLAMQLRIGLLRDQQEVLSLYNSLIKNKNFK